jgi:hypothetical protein
MELRRSVLNDFMRPYGTWPFFAPSLPPSSTSLRQAHGFHESGFIDSDTGHDVMNSNLSEDLWRALRLSGLDASSDMAMLPTIIQIKLLF